jgi:hypothetical protein
MSNAKEPLTLEKLYTAAKEFCIKASTLEYPELVGVTDGKAVGTFVEHRLNHYLSNRWSLEIGNSASVVRFKQRQLAIKRKFQGLLRVRSYYRKREF